MVVISITSGPGMKIIMESHHTIVELANKKIIQGRSRLNLFKFGLSLSRLKQKHCGQKESNDFFIFEGQIEKGGKFEAWCR